jgi:methionyl-tRNA synthetase
MINKKYITTTLPYANSNPHIGHAFEFIIADALARYFKYRGEDVFFNIGLDEHGLKIQQAAEKEGISPQAYVDNLLYSWEDFIKELKIDSWDSFYRTSDSSHYVNVQQFWVEAFNRGDIYKKKYTGTYCVGCEAFKSDRELEDKFTLGVDAAFEDSEVHTYKRKVCPDHPTTELQEVEEENYFFKLSKYKEHFLQWLHVNDKFFEPKNKVNEFDKIIENLQDISISRVKDTVSWGIPVPGDEDQIIYVWFDALLNYIFAAGYYDEGDFSKTWDESEVIQICGPDNLKFQSVIFQGLLISAEIKKTDKLLVHGTILDADGKKMSKSVGNVVDPIEQVKAFGVDAVRYYALAGLRTYGNSSWDEELLVAKYNSDLADDYGNLVTRVTVLAGKALEKFKDDPNIELDHSYVSEDKWCVGLDQRIDNIKTLWNNYLISDALQETNKLVKELNKRIGDAEPWKDLEKGWPLVLELHYALTKINELYYPVIPGKAGEIRVALKECDKIKPFPKLEIKEKEKNEV